MEPLRLPAFEIELEPCDDVAVTAAIVSDRVQDYTDAFDTVGDDDAAMICEIVVDTVDMMVGWMTSQSRTVTSSAELRVPVGDFEYLVSVRVTVANTRDAYVSVESDDESGSESGSGSGSESGSES
jgi:hypothetical protein